MKEAHDLVAAAKLAIVEIDPASAATQAGNADLLIDVREGDEFRAGHLPGALHIPRGILEFKLSGNPDYADRDLDILLYCKTSGRAALAAQSLRQMGYRRVRSIAGGFEAWQAAGLPVVESNLPSFD